MLERSLVLHSAPVRSASQRSPIGGVSIKFYALFITSSFPDNYNVQQFHVNRQHFRFNRKTFPCALLNLWHLIVFILLSAVGKSINTPREWKWK